MKVDEFIVIQQGDTRYLLKVMGKAQNLISGQYYRSRGDKYYAVWFDGRAGLEQWTNKRNLQNYYNPMICDVIKPEEVLLKFAKLGKGNTLPAEAITQWKEMSKGGDVMMCN